MISPICTILPASTCLLPRLPFSFSFFTVLILPSSLFYPNSQRIHLFIHTIPFLFSWRSPWCEKLCLLRRFVFTGWYPVEVKGLCEKPVFNHTSIFCLTSVRVVVAHPPLPLPTKKANQRNISFLILT